MTRPHLLYLDYNATTPLDPRVLEAMLPWLREGGANPSSSHAPGRRARAAVDQALGAKVLSDESARDAVRTLLARDEVKAMAENMGLDLRRANTAVSTLQGADLQRVSDRAAVANDMLTGGRQTVTISLVAVLLIVIIIILVAD